MEFPELGEHCSIVLCKQLDFLPVKCDACQKVFCKNHYSYIEHNCPEAFRRDNQVPVCPLCNKPVPLKSASELPDVVVGRHIDNDCQSETAQNRRKVYSNRCALKGCRQKELVPVMCHKCRKNFCLKHRHEMDHSCIGFDGTRRNISDAGAAAVGRAEKSKSPQQTLMSNIGRDLDRERQQRRQQQPLSRVTALTVNSLQQPGISEDEAMKQAISASLSTHSSALSSSSDERKQQEIEDEAFARALQDSEREIQMPMNSSSGQQSGKKSCTLS